MNNLSIISSELDRLSDSPDVQSSIITSYRPASTHKSASQSGGVLSATLLKLCLVGLWLGFAGQAAHAAEMAAFEIVAREGRLYPERLEVPAGVKLKLTLRNEGKTPVEIESLELRVEKVLAPNAAKVVTIQPLKPGSFTFIDEFHAETGKMLLIAK